MSEFNIGDYFIHKQRVIGNKQPVDFINQVFKITHRRKGWFMGYFYENFGKNLILVDKERKIQEYKFMSKYRFWKLIPELKLKLMYNLPKE